MKEPIENWINYWDQDDYWCSSRLWKINTELFLGRADRIVKFKKDDTVLDIGCGPGFLEMLLAERVGSILAVDTSSRYLDMCRDNCQVHGNVSTQILGEDYTSLNIPGGPFTLLLCVSVVQYYKDMSEIEALIRSAQKIAAPGARMLIADLPLNRGYFGVAWDGLCSFLMSIKHGYTMTFLKAAYDMYFSRLKYRMFSERNDIIYFTLRDIKSLIERMGLNATVIKHSLSIYSNRPSILIDF